MSKETFDFSEALKRMKQGKWVRRYIIPEAFSIRNDAIVLRGIDFLGKLEEEIHIIYSLTSIDIIRNDWQEVEE